MSSSLRVSLFAVLFAGMLFAAPVPYGERPLLFEPSADGGMAQFSAHASGRKLWFGASGAVSEWSADVSDAQPEIAMRLLHARPGVAPQSVGTQAGAANYLMGSQTDRWRVGVPLFGKILYAGVYPGVDLIYYGNQNRLEYDFVVAPGASWSSIRLAFSSAQSVAIDGNGDLRLKTRGGWLRHCRPQIYQQLASGRSEISGHYVLRGKRQVSFEIGAYDPRVPLVIDPTLVYSSYLGGSAADHGNGVAVDTAGCAYTVGETGSATFPQLNNEQGSLAGNTDIFVTKWNASGTGIVYSTYIGGSNRDAPLSIAVDTAGDAYVTGFTDSADFPVTAGALRTSFSGQTKAFVLKLNPTGNSLIYATFLGGSGNDTGTGIAVDANGQAYISGYTSSYDFPATTNAFQHANGGGISDGFFAELNATGAALIYATYLGGTGNDTATAVALDAAANVYLTGQTQSAGFPLLLPLQATLNGTTDAFVVELNAASQVLYSTYLGGTGTNIGTGIAADAAGNAYVVGYTTAPDFPVTTGAYQSINHGTYDTFVARLNASGSAILNATYFGGSASDNPTGIGLDSSGNVFIAGTTFSADLPLQAPTETAFSGGSDAFVVEFDSQLTTLNFSTYYGGALNETGTGIAVDSSGNAYVTGSTNSAIPVTNGAFETAGQGGFDAFLAKFSFAGSGSPLICSASSPAPLNIPAGGSAEPVGDLVLTCSGGVVGSTAVTDIELSLNANVAGGVQAELLIDNPASGAQLSNVNLFMGSASGASSILFSGISFTVPGPAASHTLRITNVQVNAGTVIAPGPVVATVSASSSSPVVTVIQPQQIVATPAVQLQAFTMSGSAAPASCVAPPAVTSFLPTAVQALLWFQVTGALTNDVIRMDWYAPGGTLYQSSTLAVGSGAGSQCFWDSINIAGSPVSLSGAWQVSAYWNNAPLFSAPFSISAVSVRKLLWQNTSTHQVTVHSYSPGPTDISWAWLNAAGNPGWKAVGMADMDGNGVPDLIWQNTTTRQVTVNYYGGTGGMVYQGWAYLNATGAAGWTVVAVADMNGDGVPDLIWQNDSTKQVTVNYYGGAGGATYQGWAYLNAAGNSGWTVVGAADFDHNGTPDLVWENLSTRKVTVNYYGGAIYQGWAYLNAAGNPGWTVAGAMDMNADGQPDLIWQNDTTRQVTVNYFGGSGGAQYQGWAWVNPTGFAGWQALAVN